MSELRDALLFIDLDKGPVAPGPLFEEPRRLIDGDPRLRAGWFQYQALRALALECSPDPGERLVRQAILQCKRERVGRQLAQATGAEDEARALLLGKPSEERGFPAWILGLLLLGTLGMGWMAFREDWLTSGPDNAATPASSAVPRGTNNEAVPFEFPVGSAPAEAALAAPADESASSDVSDAGDADDAHHEVPAAREARQILREHLHEAQARQDAAARDTLDDGAGDAAPDEHRASPGTRRDAGPGDQASLAAQPAPAATPLPSLDADLAAAGGALASQAVRPTAVPSTPPVVLAEAASRSSAAAAPAPTSAPAPEKQALTSTPLGLTLSSSTLARDNASVDISVGLPGRRDIDLRLFDGTGKSVRVLAVGAFGPGIQHFPVDARNDNGQTLEPGTYYVRVMTPWFSRVEPIQIQ